MGAGGYYNTCTEEELCTVRYSQGDFAVEEPAIPQGSWYPVQQGHIDCRAPYLTLMPVIIYCPSALTYCTYLHVQQAHPEQHEARRQHRPVSCCQLSAWISSTRPVMNREEMVDGTIRPRHYVVWSPRARAPTGTTGITSLTTERGAVEKLQAGAQRW